MLEAQHELALARVAAWTQKLHGDASAMIDKLFSELAAWAARPRFAGTGFTRIVMELADLPGHPARKVARRHKAAIETWFVAELTRRRLRDPVSRAREIVLLVEGASALMLIHGDAGYAQAAARAAKRLLEERRSERSRRME